MRTTDRRQDGVALPVTLLFVVLMTLTGVAATNNSLSGERSATSARAGSDATKAAEHGARNLRWELNEFVIAKGEWLTNAEAEDFEDPDWRRLGDSEDGYSPALQFRVADLLEHTGARVVFQVQGAVFSDERLISLRNLRVEVAADGGPPVPPKPFEGGVLTCDGLNQTGSAMIDSFDSRNGSYGGSNARTGEARVRTINDNADASLSGNAPIYGDLAISGDLSMSGSTPIYGDVLVQGGGGQFNGTVTGNATFGGGVDFGTSSNVQGHVVSGGDVNIAATSTPPPSIDAAGEVSYPSWWQWNEDLKAKAENYRGDQEGIAIPPVFDQAQTCDVLGIVDPDTGLPGPMFEGALNHPDATTLQAHFDNAGCSHCYQSGANGVTLSGGRDDNDASTTTLGADGATSVITVDGGLNTGGRLRNLEVRGDVTLVVDGSFDIGNNSQIDIQPGANLTVMVTGPTTLGGGSNVSTNGNEGASFVRNDKPAFGLYSAYESSRGSPGVTVSGANNSKVAVYAPRTEFRGVGSGEIFGAIRAGYIDIRGSGDIHFDVALDDKGGLGVSTPGAVTAVPAGYWEG